VRELIDILEQYDDDMEVEMAIVAPADPEEEGVAVDRYPVEGVMPWVDEDAEDGEEEIVWLVGGEEEDVDRLLDELDDEDEAEA
jgi:hypothetical protein